jgi:methylmalonyl-CoA mutase
MYVPGQPICRIFNEESNAFTDEICRDQKRISIAFDLHRQIQMRTRCDVGKGVAIDCGDMEVLSDQFPCRNVSLDDDERRCAIMAFYMLLPKSKVKPEQLSGTIQNDILKEFMVRNTYIYPPHLQRKSQIFEYTSKKMPPIPYLFLISYTCSYGCNRY